MSSVSTFCDDALGLADGVELAALLASGERSVGEVIEAAIARARVANPQINAIVTETFEQAREEAASAAGPFAGLPSFVKDTDAVEGVPTLQGSRAVPRRPSGKSSTFARHYRQLGFVSLGKSSLCEFGLTATTEPLLNGPACNPWNLAHTTGGSSGGAAALVASGVVPIAHANDGGGSIRIPAASCGLVGLKPTRGRMPPFEGSWLQPVRIVHQGMLSRSVRDTAKFYAEWEQRFPSRGLAPIGQAEQPLDRSLKIGFFISGLDGARCDRETTHAVEKTAGLCEQLGHVVEEIDFPFSARIGHDFTTYWGMMAFYVERFGRLAVGRGFDRNQLENLTLDLSAYFRRHKWHAPGIIARLRGFAKQYAGLFERFDVLLSPVVGRKPPELGVLGPDQPFDRVLEQFHQYYCYTPPQNISGAPAISLPMQRCPGGLPLGMQFAAAFGNDRLLLDLALQLEQAHPWPLIPDSSKDRQPGD